MRIDIVNKFTPSGTEYFEWSLHDGPDEVDHARGYASDLVQAFSKVFEWRERISADYVAEFEKDLETLKNFLQENETDCQPTD